MLTSNSLAVGVLLAAYTPLAVTTAMRMEVASGRDLGAGVTVMTGRALWADLRRAVGASVVCAGLLAAAVFLAAPRGVGNDWLGTFGAVPRAEVGFTDNIRLGQQGNLNERPGVQVTVTDGDGRNIRDPSRRYIFRERVRDTTDRRGIWINSAGRTVSRSLRMSVTGTSGLLAEPRPSLVFQTVQMRARIRGGDDYVFALWRPKLGDVPIRFRWRPCGATRRSNGPSSQRWSGRRSYAVESAADRHDSIDDDRGQAGRDFAWADRRPGGRPCGTAGARRSRADPTDRCAAQSHGDRASCVPGRTTRTRCK